MGNVSTRVSVTDKEREAILKEAKIRAEEAKQQRLASKTKLPGITVEDRKRKASERGFKAPAKRRKPAA